MASWDEDNAKTPHHTHPCVSSAQARTRRTTRLPCGPPSLPHPPHADLATPPARRRHPHTAPPCKQKAAVGRRKGWPRRSTGKEDRPPFPTHMRGLRAWRPPLPQQGVTGSPPDPELQRHHTTPHRTAQHRKAPHSTTPHGTARPHYTPHRATQREIAQRHCGHRLRNVSWGRTQRPSLPKRGHVAK